MKLLLIMLLSILSLNANTQNQVSNDTKLLVELIKSETKANRELIKANTELIKSETKANRDLLNAYVEEANNRFYITVTLLVLIFGYLLKERALLTTQVKQELEPELIKKADKKVLENVIAIIEELAKKDKEVEKLLHKHHLKFS
ncbi:MAG: hypothetical protein U9P72_07860 [Campylobacterota bacterium]|nr:hypothetical protein [Campylobacterota bacterium]